jgi:phenylacetate-CoA ligase
VSFSAGFGAPTPLERRIEPLSLRFRRATKIRLLSLSHEALDDVVRLLHRTKPGALAAYPSTLTLLAAHIRDSGRPAPPLHAILTGGEQVFDHQRTAIHEVFGVEPYSRYGSHENYLMATECDQHTGMHVFAQDLVLEVVDENGSQVAPGSEGRILITNLHARGMPFIRYDTGDVGSYAVSSCSCGRSMPLLDRLSGRRCDTIYTRSGARIAGTGVGMSRFALLGASQLQLVQEDMDHLTARLVVASTLTAEERADVRQEAVAILRRSLGPDIDISVEFVDHIEPSPAGKYVPVISKVDPDSWLRRTSQ